MKYHITHEKDGRYHGILVEAPAQEVAETYFLKRHPDHRICDCHEARMEDFKPGKPVMVVPEGRWKGAGMGDYYCSLCNEVTSGTPEYCPHCHAYMS